LVLSKAAFSSGIRKLANLWFTGEVAGVLADTLPTKKKSFTSNAKLTGWHLVPLTGEHRNATNTHRMRWHRLSAQVYRDTKTGMFTATLTAPVKGDKKVLIGAYGTNNTV